MPAKHRHTHFKRVRMLMLAFGSRHHPWTVTVFKRDKLKM